MDWCRIGEQRAYCVTAEGKAACNMETHIIETEQRINFASDDSTVRELEDVLSRRLPALHRSAFRVLGNAADAEDAVQDALLSAYKHLDQFRGEAHMSTWLTTIVMNCARMILRRRPRRIHLSLNERVGEEQKYSFSEQLADSAPNPEDQFHNSETRFHLRHSIARLSPRLRKTFELRELNGLSIRETADILGVPEGTVKAQFARARKKVRLFMRRALETSPDPLSAPHDWQRTLQ
jgi:RNA polymerase sigma-70 factor, ECF subfamily